MTELKPCPFCGSEAHSFEKEAWERYGHVVCGGCEATGPDAYAGLYDGEEGWQEKAAEEWNTRHTEPDEPAGYECPMCHGFTPSQPTEEEMEAGAKQEWLKLRPMYRFDDAGIDHSRWNDFMKNFKAACKWIEERK